METDQDLGERDNDEPGHFPPEDRVIHTQGYDLSINTLKEQWDDGTLVVPDFQRSYVWDNPKASRLIESLLLNIPIPVLFFAETNEAVYEIVDGHQRVYSVVRYLDNRFALSGLHISKEFKGKRFHQLPEKEQRFLRTRSMRTIVISADSSPMMKFEVFERLNTGGLSLNAQEIRNALYRGPLNELLKSLEVAPPFRDALGTSRLRRRMVDRELVLRFLALRDGLAVYRTPLVRFLNDYMISNRDPGDEWLEARASVFLRTVETVASVLGRGAFRVIDPAGEPIERNINRALFDAEMLVFSHVEGHEAVQHARQIRSEIAALFSKDSFRDSIGRATGDRARVKERVLAVGSAVEQAGVSVSERLRTSANTMLPAG